MSTATEGADHQSGAAGQRAGAVQEVTINLPPDYHADLLARADLRGCTITDLIKSALALDRYVWEHRYCELLMRDPSTDEVRQIVLIRP